MATTTNTVLAAKQPRRLSAAEINSVSGGVRDNPFADQANQTRTAQIEAEGTVGGSLLGQVYNGRPIY